MVALLEEEGLPHTDCEKRVGTGDEKSSRYISSNTVDPGEEISDSEACTATIAINTHVHY